MANNTNNADRVVILVDGSFFLKRYQKLIKGGHSHTPKKVADSLLKICEKHLFQGEKLYRILYYDCNPLDKRVCHPITKETINFAKSSTAIFRKEFFKELKQRRKVALRLGELKENNEWIINPLKVKDLFKGVIQISDLQVQDVTFNVQQKRVDMKIGLDIASLSLKKSVNKIILISGDSDFVPAAKMARREGIDFVLDPMWNPIDDALFEHIDGLRSTIEKPLNKKNNT